MILFHKTYENIKTKSYFFPIEDNYYITDTLAVVADGITRDPTSGDLSNYTEKQLFELYPRPSGAELASKVVCQTVKDNYKTINNLQSLLELSNKKIKELNDTYVKECDYLVNDWYGTVVSMVKIKDDFLEYAYVCDCGVIVYSNDGKIKFQTHDDMTDVVPHFNTRGIPWHNPQARVIIRSEFRNNIDKVEDGKCISYGALTGEETALPFIKSGRIKIKNNDIIMVYSDGFKNYFERDDFFNMIKDFDEDKFNAYIEKLANENYKLYGHEKTIVIMKNGN